MLRALLIAAVATLAAAGPARGSTGAKRDGDAQGAIVVNKDTRLAMTLGSPPQNVEARLLLSGYENFVTNQAKCTCRGRTDRTYYDAGKSSTYRAFDRFETDGYGDVVMSEDAATLAGRQIGAFPFAYVNKPPFVNGFIQTDDGVYLGLGKAGSGIVGNRSETQPWWLSLTPEPLIGLEITRRRAVTTSGQLSADYGKISFGQADASAQSSPIWFLPAATTWINGQRIFTGSDARPADPGLWAVSLDGVKVDGQSVVTRHNVSQEHYPSETRPQFEPPTMVLDLELPKISLPNETFQALLPLIPGLRKQGGSWVVPCNTTATISFIFGGSEYALHPDDWVGPRTEGDMCDFSTIMPPYDDNAETYQLGTAFLGTVYTVFKYDPGNYQVGFAKRSGPAPTPGTAAGLEDTKSSSEAAVDRARIGGLVVTALCLALSF